MLKWLKKLKSIIATHDADILNTRAQIAEIRNIMIERTNIAVDLRFRGANHVIVIGRYKNADYIQTYTMDTPEIGTLIDQLRHMERYGSVRRIDAPPNFRAVIERDTWR